MQNHIAPRHQIELAVTIDGLGTCIVPLEDLEAIRTDPLGYGANAAGVSRDVYAKFLAANDLWRCTAITGKGDRCSKWINGPNDPQSFEDHDRLCGVHKRSGAPFGKVE